MDSADIQLRRLPYPYRSMLAICSDLDETPDRGVFWETMKFLNTDQPTSMGGGVDLEVGNSIYFEMPEEQFAYWNTDDRGRELVRKLIQSGHIDCLHSYGDLAVGRSHAERALEELIRHGCRLKVWVDHSQAPTNFGADIMRGHGDELGHAAYHADLTRAYGIEYVWRGRVTSVVGQEAPPRLSGLWTVRHPLASSRTVAKEAAKNLLGRLCHGKYRMHSRNEVLRADRLRDGSPVHEFLRFNPHWGGVSSCDTGRGIGQVLTPAMLGRLARRATISVLYTHLGKVCNREVPFDPSGVAAFKALAHLYHSKKLLVTTTRRLLDYCRTLREVDWTGSLEGGSLRIEINSPPRGPASDGSPAVSVLDGLTFQVPDAASARVFWQGREMAVERNDPDPAGRESVSLPWPRLSFPLAGRC